MKSRAVERPLRIGVVLAALVFAAGPAGARETPKWFDPARHLSIDKIHRGMTGYGLSIFAGTRIEEFKVKILDVIRNFEPKRNAILIELGGCGLERTGVIQGMSGSPVYLKDPADGKFKIIGAVAFGWSFPCPGPAICGVQPIEEMMGVSPEKSVQPILVRADPDFIPAALQSLGASSASPKALKDFDRFVWSGLVRPPQAAPATKADALDPVKRGLYPLATPLGIAGISTRTFSKFADLLAPLNLSLVRTGGGSAGDTTDEAGQMVPAGVLAVPLVRGDMDLSAVGTVTDVAGDSLWGFGHSFFAQGPMELPLAAGTIHSVIPNMISSFKLGSSFKPIGTLYADQNTAVAGKIGPIPKTSPMTLTVNFCGRTQTFHYEIAPHEKLGPLLALICAHSSILADKELPELHVVRYSGRVDFEQFGAFEFGNTSSGADLGMLLADMVEPINLMMNNDFQRVKFTRIDLNVEILPRSDQAAVLQARLDRPVYRPGQTARVELQLVRVRGPETVRTVNFNVPDDLPDGEYELTLGGMAVAVAVDRRNNPQAYRPTNAQDLFDLIRRVGNFRADKFYLALNTQREGVGIRRYGMADLPGSKLQQIQEADPALVARFTLARLFQVPSDFVVAGQDSLKLVISRNP